LTVWFSEEAIEAWAAEPRTTRGGQPWYSALAILTALTLRAVFRLAYRQAEGLIGSVIGLLGLALRVPDHTTLSRRAATLEVPRPPRSGSGCGAGGGEAEPVHLLVDSTGLRLCGAGEWLLEKHGTRIRRSWRKLHLGVDADTGRILASAPTDRDVDDGAQAGPLLDQVAGPVASLSATAGTTRSASTTVSRSATPRRPSSCRRARRRCRARWLRPRPRGATAISGASPRTAAWPGRRRPDTRSGREPKPPWAGSSA
jgi:hypothetical protein